MTQPDHWNAHRGDDAEPKHHGGEPSQSSARKLCMLADLLYNRHVRYSAYKDGFGVDERSFQRDLQHLRQIGKNYGFSVSKIKARERAELIPLDRRSPALDADKTAAALMSELGAALGGAAAVELGGDGATAGSGFARWIVPRMAERSKSKTIYEALKRAYAGKPPASVEFTYDPGKGAPSTLRRVEPYRVWLRSGRDYLLGFDLDKKTWRTFALDAITTTPRRIGSILNLRDVPARYDAADVIGFFRTDTEPVDVTVELTAAVAYAVLSREWQAGQVVKRLSGGRAQITFQVSDVDEVVRWALGLGKEAHVVSPPAAVQLARRIVREVAAMYDDRGHVVGDEGSAAERAPATRVGSP